MSMRKIRLGDVVEDTLTDFKGTVVAKANYLHGCIQCEVQPREFKDGHVIEAVWIDEPQLRIIKLTTKKKAKPKHGGVRCHP